MSFTPNSLHLIRGSPNPRGVRDAELFLFTGDATQPIEHIVFDADLPARRTDVRDFRLRVLHINDLHGNLADVTARDCVPVFSRIVSRVRAARRADDANAATIFVSAGDDLVGTAFEELLCRKSLAHHFNPAYRLYSETGVDVATLGNHEFDAGTEFLADSIRKDARFPILCANLTQCPRLDGVVFPAALLLIDEIRVGIIGLTTSAEVIRRDDPNLTIAHPITVAQNLLPAIRGLCDVLILLTHLGHSLTATTAVTRDAGDYELAQSLPTGACDLIIGGHTHVALNTRALGVPNIVNGIPVAQAGAAGEWLGEVDMTLNPRPTRVAAHLIAVSELPVDAEFESERVQPLSDQVRTVLSEELGRAERVETRTSESSSRESAIANFIADATVERCRLAGFQVDFAMIDDSPVSCNIESGMFTFENWFNLIPHADILRLYQIRGDQLPTLLGDNARRANRDAPCVVQFSREVRYEIDHDNAHAVRVNDVPLDGQHHRVFIMACSSFTRQRDHEWQARAATNGWNTLTLGTLTSQDTPLRLRDEVVAYVRDHGGVIARWDGRKLFIRPTYVHLEKTMNRRMNHIFRGDGRALIVAMDHGLLDGPKKGLEHPAKTIAHVIAGGADAILTSFGVARTFSRELAHVGLIVRADGGATGLSQTPGPGALILSVEQALSVDADAIAISAFPGSPQEQSSLEHLAHAIEAAHKWNLGVMAEMVPGGFDSPPELRTIQNIALAARVGAEMGADFVKCPYAPGMENVTQTCFVPVVILGGAKRGAESGMLVEIKHAIDEGVSGVAIGRNIWQAENPTAMTRAIAAILHEHASSEQALQLLEM